MSMAGIGLPSILSLLTSMGEGIFGPSMARAQQQKQLSEDIRTMPYLSNAQTTMSPPMGIRPFYDSTSNRVIYEAPIIPSMRDYVAMGSTVFEPNNMVARLNDRRQSMSGPPQKSYGLLGGLFG